MRNGCKKETVGFSKEMLSKICKNPCSCFGYRLSYNHPNEVIPIGKEPKEIGLKMYRMKQEQICKTRENFNFLKKGKMVILVKI